MPVRRPPSLAVIACALLALACGPSPPPEAPNPGVVNQSLGLRLAVLPDDLEVQTNTERSLVLKPQGARDARIDFLVGPEDPGPNLVAMVQADQQRIEQLEDGEYLGARELQTPFGTGFYSRGRYQVDGKLMEETRVIGFHPRGDRTLTLSYLYPAAEDSSQRVTRLLDLFAQLEALTTVVTPQ